MSYRVLLLSKYSRSGASSRLRTTQYLPALREDNCFDVVAQALFDDAYLDQLYRENSRSKFTIARCYGKRLAALLFFYKYDLIWIEKEVFPYLPALFERVLRCLGRPYVVDYDDAVFHYYDCARSWIVRTLLGRKIDHVMRFASCVIVGNRYLADRAEAAGARSVVIVPTVVDHTRYFVKDQTAKDRLVVGWIGSPCTQKYLLEIHDALIKVSRICNPLIVLVGAHANFAADLPGLELDIRPWSEEKEVELIRQMDIGIMPLPDEPFERGKCGYKLIQYMACGVPVVASPIGVNTEIVLRSQCGLLADSQEAWETALLDLLGSPATRSRMGANGRTAVEECYSLASQVPLLASTIKAVIEKRGR